MADLLAAAYAASGSAHRDQWRCDNWSAACAQIGAAHAVTSAVVNGLLMDAVTLRERLPQVGAVFAEGLIAYRLVHLICERTRLVKGAEALRGLDAELAQELRTWGARSVEQAGRDIDALVLRHDRYAVRRTETRSRSAYLDVATEPAKGTAYVSAAVSATDGAAFDQRADALARTVCRRDPRDLDQRRAAAVGAMGFGWDRLPCLCEHDDCDAATTPPVGGVVIHVIARHDTLDTTHDPDDGANGADDADDADGADGVDGPWDSQGARDTEAASDSADRPDVDDPCDAVDPSGSAGASDSADPRHAESADADAAALPETDNSTTATVSLTDQRRALVGEHPPLLPRPWYTYTLSGLTAALNTDPGQLCPAAPAVILGGAVLPAPVAAQAALHATLRELIHPGQAPPEPRYRPSRTLAEFVRCRDQTCRFPGCTRPATIGDIDHTIPYPYGPTCASNLACLPVPRTPLAQTFWPGWSNRQFPDGTIVWTAPDGNTNTTYPGSRLLFPELCTPTTEFTLTGTPPPKHTAGLTMPKRTTTRTQTRQQRINHERRHNGADT
jgi:Domain of unknown function (DUF222)